MKPLPLCVTMAPGFAKLGLQEMMPQELYFHPSSDVLDIRSVGTTVEVLSGLGGCFGLFWVFEALEMAMIKHLIYSGQTPVSVCRSLA